MFGMTSLNKKSHLSFLRSLNYLTKEHIQQLRQMTAVSILIKISLVKRMSCSPKNKGFRRKELLAAVG
jgi:hypothetical protein